MAEDNSSSISYERLLLIVVSILLVLALAYIAFDLFSNREAVSEVQEPDVAQQTQPEEQPEQSIQLPTEAPDEQEPEQVVETELTPTPRRLVLPPTPTAFEVTDEDDPRAILDLSNPDVVDYFRNSDNWFDYDSPGFASYEVRDDRMVGIDYDPENTNVYWSFNSRPSGNTYVEISTTNGDCIGKDAVGRVMRIDEESSPSGYALEVSCDGAWRFLRYSTVGKTMEEFIPWTPSEVIAAGNSATNRLGIWGYAGKFNLFVNGFEVGEYFDRNYTYSYGYFAAYVRAESTYDLPAYFDDFAMWDIPFIP